MQLCLDLAHVFLPEFHVYQAEMDRILTPVELELNKMTEVKRRFQLAADDFKRAADKSFTWEKCAR